MSKYINEYNQSINFPNDFWSKAAENIYWYKKFDLVLDESRKPYYRWFTGGKLNTCYNAVDRHVKNGLGEKTAIIYDSPVTQTKVKITYSELQKKVSLFAGALKSIGIAKGDRVIIYMPMIPEAIIGMLACARLGAIHSVVFGGFASHELATRIDDAEPKVILSASGAIEGTKTIAYKPLLDEAISQAKHKPKHAIIFQRNFLKAEMRNDFDLDWNDFQKNSAPTECESIDAHDPLYILYTSGTTGQPKGIVRDNGGHAVALNWTMKNIYNINSEDVFWAASDVGWVVGHSYIVYGPLLCGCTTVMYEGKPIGTPDAGAFWRMIEEYKINVLFTAPTAFRAIRKEDPDGLFIKKYNLNSLKALFLAGERSDPATLTWAENLLNVPVVDHWWQTETGWAIAANCLGIESFKIKHGSPTKPVPGWQLKVVDEGGNEVDSGQIGSLVCKLPLPPGTLPTLWKAEQRFFENYLQEYPGYYKTADAGMIDLDGYVFVMSRTDDIINVAGHRLSTGAIEEVLSSHASVAECAVIGIHDEIKGQIPLGFLVLKANVKKAHDEIIKEVIQLVRDQIGPVAFFKKAVIVERLPKTRSGKILRGTMQKIANRDAYKMPATIDDPSILDEIKEILRKEES